MASSQEASANPAEMQQVARSGAEKNGNSRGPQQTGRTSAPAQPKQGSQAPASLKSGTSASHKANGTEASGPPKNSWANIARAGPVNGAPADKAAAAPAPTQPAAATGVKLPAGVAPGPAAQGSIKFGSIGPAELQQGTQAPAPAAAKPAPPAPAAAKPAAAPAPAPAPQPSKPVSFAAAASGGTAPKQQAPSGGQQQQPPPHQQRGPGGGGPGGRAPRAQPVAATIPQSAGFNSQPMATAFLLSPGAPVPYAHQTYMLYNPAVSTQQYFAGGFGQAGQYPGFNYGTPPQGGNMPTGPHGPQPPVQSMPAPPPPPQVSSSSGAASATVSHGSYGNAPSSPLPARTGTASTPPPAREKKILRIENPETHEVLNLADIAASKKPAASGGESAAPAQKDQPAADDKAAAASKSFKDVAIRPKSEEGAPAPAPEPKKAEQPAESQAVKEVAKEAKPEVAEKLPVIPAKPVEVEQAEATNGELSQPEESEETATDFEDEETERPLPDDGRKRYTNSFMLGIAPLCKDLPPQIEMATLSALQWVEGMGEKPPAPPRPPERDWKSGSRGPPGGMPGGGPGGMRGGRGRGRGNMVGIDSDTWERGKALPPMPGNQFGGRGPPPGMRMPSGPLPALHKTDSAYKIGNVITDDPEEEKAQKALKSTLNKITPQNFEKITAQIIEKIKERGKAKTLSGFIDQIFDKALIETTFAELYAKLVASLNPALPELADDDGTPVQFRRTLLNKCQEEFERGALAMKAVADREKREHEKPVEEEQVEETPKEVEEGEISEEQREKEETKRRDKAAADAEVKARKRMLGNIIFVGQLYRFGVLTESVMHSCIQQLLEETQNPRSEDIECLCKLLTTVGRPMDGSQRSVKRTDENGNVTTTSTRDMMGAYFKRIEALVKNEEALDSRHRFMLADLIDLRKDNWVLRRATEGPKKIDDIHRDAALERSRSQMLDRQSSRGGRDQRGPPRPAFDNRVDAPIRTMNRVGSQDSLASSFRPGGRPAPPPRPAPPASERPPIPAKPESGEEPKAEEETASEAQELSADQAASKVKGLLAELYNSRDIKEAVLCVKELADGKADMANVFESFLINSLEGKDTSWETLQDLCKTCGEEKLIAQADFEQGARQLLDKLDDLTVDVPKAPIQVGDVLSSLLANDMADIKVVAQHILEADAEPVPEGEDSMMVDSGVALKVLGVTLRGLKTAKGGEETASAWKATGLDYKSYIAVADREDAAVAEKFVNDYELADIL